MTLDDYIKQAKDELDQFAQTYRQGHEEDPENWPMDTDYGEWCEQELATRFS